MIKVEMRNETASNHYKQTQMGVLEDETTGGNGGVKIQRSKFYFHMHKQNWCKSGSDLTYVVGLLTWGCAVENRIDAKLADTNWVVGSSETLSQNESQDSPVQGLRDLPVQGIPINVLARRTPTEKCRGEDCRECLTHTYCMRCNSQGL